MLGEASKQRVAGTQAMRQSIRCHPQEQVQGNPRQMGGQAELLELSEGAVTFSQQEGEVGDTGLARGLWKKPESVPESRFHRLSR